MSLPLCQFPLLIHVEIFKHLEFEQIFMLSLCSENTKRLIQRIRLKAKKLRYTIEDDQVSVHGGFTDDERDLEFIAAMKCVTSISRKKTISVKLGGEPIKCRFERNSHTLKYLEPENKNALELLKNLIDSLFHSKPIIQLKLHSPDSLSSSNIFDDISDTSFMFENLDASELEAHLTKYPNHHSLDFFSDLTKRDLKQYSKIWEIEGLTLRGSRLISSRAMKYFSGRCLILHNAEIMYSALIKMIPKWQKKEGLHILHAVVIHTFASDDFIDELLDELNVLDWDGITRLKMFNYDPRYFTLTLE
ncbi:hypothetical protein CRE_26895 [Caenorhabditis remanei]|uniref:F-box domain-containing protein n=1 Tax=Caenorhabditis remanei TaxID=31234 RepID=E3NSB1_CAERE|nr:hypothetical protein CRE_26895 [Caenorhabditis remanei]